MHKATQLVPNSYEYKPIHSSVVINFHTPPTIDGGVKMSYYSSFTFNLTGKIVFSRIKSVRLNTLPCLEWFGVKKSIWLFLQPHFGKILAPVHVFPYLPIKCNSHYFSFGQPKSIQTEKYKRHTMANFIAPSTP